MSIKDVTSSKNVYPFILIKG